MAQNIMKEDRKILNKKSCGKATFRFQEIWQLLRNTIKHCTL